MKRGKLLGAAVLLAAAAGLALIGQPDAWDKLARQDAQLEARLAAEEARIDPGELFDLTQNNQVRLDLVDVRSQADFNIFHLTDARRVELNDVIRFQMDGPVPESVTVVMSNDERAAEQAWKLLAAQGVPNVYILGGGINHWLTVYRDGAADAPLPPRGAGDDTLRHTFTAALGADQAGAHPDPARTAKREYAAKVKLASQAKRPGGGCG